MRKLLMLAAMALAAVVLAGVSATAASADVPFEVQDPGSGQRCDDVLTWDDIGTSASCYVDDVEGDFDLYSGSTFINSYSADFDLAVGGDGVAYGVNASVQASYPGIARRACTNSEGYSLLWPVQIRALGGGEFEADMTICIVAASAQHGTAGSYQTVTLDIEHFGTDGWTELVQGVDALNIRNGEWSSANTVDLVEIEEE